MRALEQVERRTTDVRFVPSDDCVEIAYEVHGTDPGDAPTLVLVHGWACDRTYWSAQVEELSRRHRVVVIDLAGHGKSGADRQEWTIEAFGVDVVAVVERLGLERAVLVGHSMGGDVILEAARRLSGIVAGLIWVDAHRQIDAPLDTVEVERFMAPFVDDFAGATRKFVRSLFRDGARSDLVERAARQMSAAPPPIALGAMKSALSYGRRVPAVLAELALPIVALNADFRPTDLEDLKRHGVEVFVVGSVGHFLMMEAPERFNRALEATLGGFPRRDSR